MATEVPQAMQIANYGGEVYKEYILDLFALATHNQRESSLSPTVKRVIHSLYRNGDAKFKMTQQYRDLDYSITINGEAAISDRSTFMLFTYDNIFEYKTIDELIEVLMLAKIDI